MAKRKTQNQLDRTGQKVYSNERGKLGQKYKTTLSGEMEMAGDFSVIVDAYFWEQLESDNDHYDFFSLCAISPLLKSLSCIL